MAGSDRYVHALRYPWLTRFYDRVVQATLPERALKALLCREVLDGLHPGGRLLDLGCGTGTLTVMLKQRAPEAEVVGFDGDREVLELARVKAEQAGVEVGWLHGDAGALPFGPGQLDRVASSLMFHHLSSETKRAALRAVRRSLAPGGRLHVLDWGRPHDVLMRLAFLPVQLLDGFATTSDNVAGRLVPMLEEAGFADVQETARRRTVFGTLSLYRGTAP